MAFQQTAYNNYDPRPMPVGTDLMARGGGYYTDSGIADDFIPFISQENGLRRCLPSAGVGSPEHAFETVLLLSTGRRDWQNIQNPARGVFPAVDQSPAPEDQLTESYKKGSSP